jgi:hypothetical protein
MDVKSSRRKPMNSGDTTNQAAADSYNISATNLVAKAVVYGRNSTANVTEIMSSDQSALRDLVAQLEHRLSGTTGLGPERKTALQQHVAGLSAAAGDATQIQARVKGHFRGLEETLKQAGVVAGEVASLLEPARKIASLLGVSI